MHLPISVLATTHRTSETLRFNNEDDIIQGNQQINLTPTNLEIRKHDGASPVGGDQLFDLPQRRAF